MANGTPKDFVYAGRAGRTGHFRDVVIPIEADGSLGNPWHFEKTKSFRSSIVGGIYRGASFDETTAYGLGSTTFQGRWPDRDAILGWEATTRAVNQAAAAARMERDEKIPEIERTMLPLRKLYANAAKRYDSATMDALRLAVVSALITPPRKEELE